MICSACRRRVDPQRSFCPNCGSAVFIDPDDAGWRAAGPAPPATQSIDQSRALTTRPRRSSLPPLSTRRQSSGGSPTPRSSVGCLGCLTRLALLVAIVWYVGGWLRSIPEVRTLLDGFLSGSISDDQVNAAVEAVRTQIEQLFGGTASH